MALVAVQSGVLTSVTLADSAPGFRAVFVLDAVLAASAAAAVDKLPSSATQEPEPIPVGS